MSEEESVRPVVEKDTLKEALAELLNEMPAFRAWKEGGKPSAVRGAGPSDAGPSSRPLAAGPPSEQQGPGVAVAGAYANHGVFALLRQGSRASVRGAVNC